MRNGEPPKAKGPNPKELRRGRSARETILRFTTGVTGLAATVGAGVGGASALAVASGVSATASGAGWGSGLDAGAGERGTGAAAVGPGVATAASLVVGAVLRGGG
jgi:hypothetical protein